jgi:uncharacterized membrane protein YphA (DoxX/SURF4 family)
LIVVALLAQITTAVIFLSSGISKMVEPTPIKRTLTALGVPEPSVVAPALGSLEVITAVTIVILGGGWVPALLLAVLACLFCVAAVMAMARGIKVSCACLGSSRTAPLGWRQLALLPVWLAVASSAVATRTVLANDRVPILFGVLLLVAVPSLWHIGGLYAEHRAQWKAIAGS